VDEVFAELRQLIQSCSEGALATLEDRRPFVSATGYILEDKDHLAFAMLLSDLSRHTRNIRKNPFVSLLIVEEKRGAPIHEKRRATFMGQAALVEDTLRHECLRKSYRERFPGSDVFFSLPDFHFYAVVPEEVHWIGGFAKAKTLTFQHGKWQ